MVIDIVGGLAAIGTAAGLLPGMAVGIVNKTGLIPLYQLVVIVVISLAQLAAIYIIRW